MEELEFHPIANIFPLIDGAELDALVADVTTHGVREPIWLYEGQILDGRNRYRAANAAGKEWRTRTFEGTPPPDPKPSRPSRRSPQPVGGRLCAAARRCEGTASGGR